MKRWCVALDDGTCEFVWAETRQDAIDEVVSCYEVDGNGDRIEEEDSK